MKINLQKFKDLLISKGEKGAEIAKELISEHEFKQFKLSTEELIEVEGEKIGKDMEVFLLADDGKKPLPQGEYQTAEGYRFTVNEMGVVTKVDEDMVSEEKFNAIEAKLQEFSNAISNLTKLVEKSNSFTSEAFKDLAKAIEAEPQGEEPNPIQHEFKNEKLSHLIKKLQK
jgi:hypothetical protein